MQPKNNNNNNKINNWCLQSSTAKLDKMNLFRLLTLVHMWAHITLIVSSQSTCPVISNSVTDLNHQQQQRCKCGIKTDGQIYIYCARKQLKSLPKFTRSSILYEELILSGNQIEKISVNSFNGLRVKRLFIDDNPLGQIESNSFTELANYLEELVISVSQSAAQRPETEKPALPLSIFQNLLNLKILKLANLELGIESTSGQLRQSTFNRTRKLEVIHLVDFGLQRIEKNALAGLEFSLKELNLDNNQLTSTLDIFSEIKRMKRLESLVLSRNKIRKLARFVSSNQNSFFNSNTNNENDLSEIQLDLSFNAINQIDEFAFGISNVPTMTLLLAKQITKLNMNNNELNQFQLSFIGQLVNLKELYLDYNKIENLPDNLFLNSRYLEHLSLRGNSIVAIQSEFSFSGLHFNLKRLNLASNKMQSLGKRVFMQTSKLRELSLERNNLGIHFDSLISNSTDLNVLMNTFEGIESELKTLNLESNQLQPSHLWSIANLLNLETLKLGNNKMSSLSLRATLVVEQQQQFSMEQKLFKVFEFYRNLSILDMQNSSLTQMPYFISLNNTLTALNLAQNQICHVNSNNLRSVYAKLKNLNLNMNPLKCDCNMIGLREWISEISEPNTASWKCSSPNLNKNKLVNQLHSNYDFNCDLATDEIACSLDEDEVMFRKSTTTTTTTTTSTSTTSTTSPTTSTTTSSSTIYVSTTLPLLILTGTSSTLTKLVTVQDTDADSVLVSNNETFRLNKIDSLPTEQSQKASSTAIGSFFSSIELKQTLLGSFIGALSVILIVFLIIVIFKVTHKRYRGKELSSICNTLSTHDNDKDKSNRTQTTSGSSSPYDLTKLSLCINNCGGSSSNNSSATSSGSSSAGSCTSSLGVTNSSCICGILKSAGLEMNHESTAKECLFNKMDPLRLTMLSSASNLINANNNMNNSNNNNNNTLANGLANGFQNRTSFYQHYLNCNNQPNQMYNCNNIQYIASHLPYSSPSESLISGSCPSPYQLSNTDQNESQDNKQANSTGKLFSFLSGKAYSNSSNSNLINTSSSNTNNNHNASLLNGTTESNTYDKLHQRLNNSCSFIKPNNNLFNSNNNNNINNNTLGYSANANNQCVHNFNTISINDLVCNNNRNLLNGETTPFLILANGDLGNHHHRLIDLNTINENTALNNALLISNNNSQPNFIHLQKINQQVNNESCQHTYHEIGDVLLNLNNAKQMNLSRLKEEKSEMFI